MVKIEVPDLTGAECGEIAITAAEGGIGYWSVIEKYDWKRWSPDAGDCIEVADDFVFYTIRFENPEPGAPEFITADITPEVLRNGFQKALDLGYAFITSILSTDREDWTGEIDSDAADVIVQCGVMGEVVFS